MSDEIEVKSGEAGDLGTVETQARRMGWVPKEDFKGDPERWVEPDKFIERAETVLPIAKGTIKEMQRLMAEQEANFKKLLADQAAKFDKLQESTGKFVEFARKSEERAYAKALADLKAKQLAAAEDRDVAGVEAIGAEIEKHILNHPAVTGVKPAEAETTTEKKEEAKTAPGGNGDWIQPGVFEAWQEENVWYNTVPKMAVYAEQMDKFFMRTQPTQTQKQRLAAIAEAVREEFPEYWQNPKRRAAAAVEGAEGGGEKPQDGKRSYANLTAEARKLCDEFSGKDGKGTGTIPGFTREEYLAQCDPSLFK